MNLNNGEKKIKKKEKEPKEDVSNVATSVNCGSN